MLSLIVIWLLVSNVLCLKINMNLYMESEYIHKKKVLFLEEKMLTMDRTWSTCELAACPMIRPHDRCCFVAKHLRMAPHAGRPATYTYSLAFPAFPSRESPSIHKAAARRDMQRSKENVASIPPGSIFFSEEVFRFRPAADPYLFFS